MQFSNTQRVCANTNTNLIGNSVTISDRTRVNWMSIECAEADGRLLIPQSLCMPKQSHAH